MVYSIETSSGTSLAVTNSFLKMSKLFRFASEEKFVPRTKHI
jgi:hypothetical protein